MNSNLPANLLSRKQEAIEVGISLALILVIASMCFSILSPFLVITAWAAIIAISLYTPYRLLAQKLGGREKLAVTIILVIGFAIVIVPMWAFTKSIVESGAQVVAQAQEGELSVPPPKPEVKEWPVIGEKLYAAWSAASNNLSAQLKKYRSQIKPVIVAVLSGVANTGLGVLQFLISLLIAAAFLLGSETAHQTFIRLFRRLAEDNGEPLLRLAVSTIRSVAVGVLGIAAIQALLAGIGMLAVGVPAVGLWVVVALILAIAQLPVLLVMLPMIIWVFSVESTTVAVLFTIWSLIASFSDMILKPVLLGRGVEAPMLVILLGAIGGMIVAGIVGLFLGAVILAFGYKLFDMWVRLEDEAPPEPADGA
jgi:predicted PurR-regulated permease PerM